MSPPVPLPVDAVVDDVVIHLVDRPAVIVTAPPGSGKTTRVPPAILRALQAGRVDTDGEGMVWLVQPRRVAARLAASRIASEWGEPPGRTVGWRVRFEDRTSADTRLVAMTEGMLLRQLQSDPFLEAVSVVVLDEVHERSLDLDVAVALLAELQRDARPDLRLVVMSATLELAPLLALFGDDTPVVRAEGRRFDVAVRYLPRPSTAPVVGQVAGAVRRLVTELPDGHILAFLPGVGEIRRTFDLLADLSTDSTGTRVEVLPLHGRLSLTDQARALEPVSHRKVVLATNIAETSITLDGVVAVVDSGQARQLRFESSTGVSHLETVDVARASADQRAGRAGRTREGIAVRLWTEDQHRIRPAHDVPELRRADLCSTVLRLADLGVSPESLAWMERPPASALALARDTLSDLGALASMGLTPLGRTLAALPVHPRLGAVVARGLDLGGLRSAATAAALVSEGNPWRLDDHRIVDLALLVEQVDRGGGGASRRLLQSVRKVRDQLVRALGGVHGRPLDDAELADCLLAGFPERLAKRREPGSLRFKLASGRGATLHRPEVLPHAMLAVAVELQGRGVGVREDVIFLAAELPERVALSRARWSSDIRFDADSGRVVAEEVAHVGRLQLGARPLRGTLDDARVSEVLFAALEANPEDALQLSESGQAWLSRARFVAHHRPDVGLPAFDVDTLREVLLSLVHGCRSLAELQKRDALAHLRSMLTWDQQRAIDHHAPASLQLPSGSNRTLQYREPTEAPVLAARIQQVFGWTETPRVAGGRVPVLLHLLAPNNRPAQLTSDLASFWANTWSEVRRDLRGRYPKHAWPEDPTTALPEDRPRRRR